MVSVSNKPPRLHRRLSKGSKRHKRDKNTQIRKRRIEFKTNNVHNLTTYKLPNEVYSLLNKGLGFIPTPTYFNFKNHLELLI